MAKKQVSLSLESEVYKTAQAEAIMQGTRISEVVNSLLKAWLSSGVPISKVRRVANGGDDNDSK